MRAAADLSIRYITDRHLPDKAIDLIDEAARGSVAPAAFPPTKDAQRELDRVTKEKEAAIKAGLRGRGQSARRRGGREGEPRHDPRRVAGVPGRRLAQVTEEDIAQVVAMWTGIPVTRIAQEESDRLMHMEDALREKVIGQDEAIDTIAKAVRRARAGLKDPKRPIGSFIFLGPTGVGKTWLAKALAEFMFGSEERSSRST